MPTAPIPGGIIKRILASACLGLVLATTATPALATPYCTTTTEWIVVVDVPAQAAVYTTEYEFVHKHANHPNSPRWEAEGWNADSNPHSVGWRSTGNTRQVLVTPATEAVTHQKAVETTTCVEVPPVEPPVIVPDPVPEPPTPVPAPEPPAPAPLPAPVPAPAPAAVPAAVAAPVAAAPAAELAYTGVEEDAAILATIAGGVILAGSALLFIRRRLIKE